MVGKRYYAAYGMGIENLRLYFSFDFNFLPTIQRTRTIVGLKQSEDNKRTSNQTDFKIKFHLMNTSIVINYAWFERVVKLNSMDMKMDFIAMIVVVLNDGVDDDGMHYIGIARRFSRP